VFAGAPELLEAGAFVSFFLLFLQEKFTIRNKSLANFSFLRFLHAVMLINQNTYTFNFKSGYTSQMKREVSACDAQKISAYLANYQIKSDFKNDKTAAWCVLKCFELLRNFNKQFNLNLGFPNGIFVEDFNKLRVDRTGVLGFTNFAPAKLFTGKDCITPEKTIFFDKLDWYKADEISDENYKFGISTTDFFLETFLHEFMHVIHEDNLLKQKSGSEVITILQKMLNPQFITTFRSKYETILKSICDYAAENPLEAVACDISKRVLNSIDKNTLIPQNNFTLSSPYKKLSLLEIFYMLCSRKQEKKQLLNKIWTGNL